MTDEVTLGRGGLGRWRLGNPVRRLVGAVLYPASRLSRRDRRLWVFGNSRGFRDNSRYLAEHVHHERPGIEVWWIARTARELDEARAAGLRAAQLASRRAWRVQARAGVGFLTSQYSDLRTAVMGGAYIVHLHHGVPLKRILLDVDRAQVMAGPPIVKRLFGALSQRLLARRLARVSLVVAPGALARRRYLTAFGVPSERIVVLGAPRFDVILGGPAYERAAGGDIRLRLGIASDAYVVLWLPTWRDSGDGWLPPLSTADVETALGGTNAILLVKPHPFSDGAAFRAWLPDHPQVRLLDQAEVDANCLLRLGDALVTDYSSVAFDYSILDRPLYLFVPDATHYATRDRGVYETLDEYSGGSYSVDWHSLLNAIAVAVRGDDADGVALARRVRERSGNMSDPGSCERITGAVMEAVKLGRD